jgi:curved DNA-binding protein
MAKKDYYDVLGIPKNATDDQLKKAYRKLAMQYHPDRNPGKEQWANDKFKEINEAYGILGDPEKRKQYDQFGTVGDLGDIFSSANTRTTFEDLMKDFGGAGLGLGFLDGIFGNMFKNGNFSFKVYSSGMPGASGRTQYRGSGGINLDDILRQAQRPQQARKPQLQEVRYEIAVTKEQAIRGMEKVLVRKGKKLKVKIPAGVQTGSKVRLRNARQVTDGQPGDILIHVKVK